MALQVACPNCQILVEWTEANPYRPFCSLRCKNEDLCAWADEQRTLSGDHELDDRSSESDAEPD